MLPQVMNVDILDDKEPIVFVQKYIYPDRIFQVFRKPTSEAEEFAISPGVTIDRDLFWGVGFTLFDTVEDLSDDLLEIFALVYLDEENPPIHAGETPPGAEERVVVTYDPEADCYRCEPCLVEDDEISGISAPTLDEAIVRGVDKLHEILARQA